MQQLSAQDASFLYQETAETPMHVGSVAILDPTGSPYGPLNLKTALGFYESRLHLMPMARRRLVRVPFDADYPYWVEDPDFDLEYHVREIALPEPADWRQFYILCARILARPLDLQRPPWEVYLVHGLLHLKGIHVGAVGVLTKIHHCAVDAASGTDMAVAMADLSPEMEPPSTPRMPWRGERLPSDAELMARSLIGNLTRPAHAARLLAESLGSNRRIAPLMGGSAPSSATAVPRTRFNRPVSPHRTIGFERFALDEVRAMKRAVEGATVNDVALAICGGGLRYYLEAKRELPGEPLVAMAPISTRKSGDGYRQGNQVSAMFVPIGSHVADPAERLAAVRDATHGAKQMSNAIGAELMTRYGEFVPAALSNLGQRLAAEYARANAGTPAFNCSITNVPGPQIPLYMMGCRVVTTLGYGPIAHNMGLIIPIGSYCGELTVSFTACRGMVPDPDFLQQCLCRSFDDTRRATLGPPAAAKKKVARVARDYAHMAEQALADVRATRERAAAAS